MRRANAQHAKALAMAVNVSIARAPESVPRVKVPVTVKNIKNTNVFGEQPVPSRSSFLCSRRHCAFWGRCVEEYGALCHEATVKPPAVRKMKVGPSEPLCRRRLQTGVGCCKFKAVAVNATDKRRDSITACVGWRDERKRTMRRSRTCSTSLSILHHTPPTQRATTARAQKRRPIRHIQP
jgi:hypothetical protein